MQFVQQLKHKLELKNGYFLFKRCVFDNCWSCSSLYKNVQVLMIYVLYYVSFSNDQKIYCDLY